jgi:hypothetical protein
MWLQTKNNHPHRHRKHKNISMFVFGLVAALLFSQSQFFQSFIQSMSGYPAISAFIAGMLFASTFTIAAGGLIIINLAHTANPILLIVFGGLGAVSCDLLIFYFFKDKVAKEISPIYDEFISKSHLKKIMHTRAFAWTLPVIGAFIIASPLPDELGVSLMGFSQMKVLQFFLISLGSHLIGMSSLIVGSHFL